MKIVAEPENLKPRRFIIKQDKAAGFYLLVYENGHCIRDHLQDTIEQAMSAAFEMYEVPKESWQAET